MKKIRGYVDFMDVVITSIIVGVVALFFGLFYAIHVESTETYAREIVCEEITDPMVYKIIGGDCYEKSIDGLSWIRRATENELRDAAGQPHK